MRLAPVQTTLPDWNDLRLVLAVARGRGLVGAAASLGLDHSTVFRRLQAVEGRLGHAVFERLAAGVYEPTDLGARVVAAAERVEAEILGLARDAAGRDSRLTGRLRVASSETLAYRLLTRHIAAFRVRHPGLVVSLSVENRVLSLTRREADVALRPMRPREAALWGRKLADVAWGAYRVRGGQGALGSVAALGGQPMIGWEEGIAGIAAADWLADAVPAEAFVFRSSSLVNQLVAARAGLGVAVLPCYLGDPEPGLERALAAPLPSLRSEMWMVTHQDLRRTARVQAFFELVVDGMAADRTLIEGGAA